MSKEWAFHRKIYYDTIHDFSVYLKTGSNYAPFVLRLKTSNAKSTSKKTYPVMSSTSSGTSIFQ